MFNSVSNTPFTMPVMPAVGGYGANGGFADGGWLWIIVVFALLFGWGNNGFGGIGGNCGGGAMQGYATQADIQRGFDTSSIISKLDGITTGLCDGFYGVNNSIMNGFHGVDNAICNLGYHTQQGFNTTNMAMMQSQNAIQTTLNNMAAQNASCCCETQRQIERGFADTNYNMATQACETRQAIADSTRSIIDFLTQDKIATLTAENQNLKFQASQVAQNQFITANQDAQTSELIRRLGKDYPVNAVVVQPSTPVTFPVNGCGNFAGYSNAGCGCGCGC